MKKEDEEWLHRSGQTASATDVGVQPERAAGSNWRYTLAAGAFIAVVMQAGSVFLPTFVLPSWGEIVGALPRVDLADVLLTLARVLGALFASFFVGGLLALLAHKWAMIENYVVPLVRLVMAVPAVAWIVMTILWFPTIELRILFVLSVVCVPVFTLDMLDGMKSVPKNLRNMISSFRPTVWEYYSKLMIPSVLPTIFTSWKVNISLAVRVATIAELVGAASGMGHVFALGRNLFNMPLIFAATVILVLQLFALQGVVVAVERKMLAWRD